MNNYSKRISFSSCVRSVISSLSNNDDDYGVENNAKKMNLRRLKPVLLHLFGSALFFKCGRFFLELNHKDLIQVQNRKENSSLYVHVLHKTCFVGSSVSFDCIRLLLNYSWTSVKRPVIKSQIFCRKEWVLKPLLSGRGHLSIPSQREFSYFLSPVSNSFALFQEYNEGKCSLR